MGDNKSMNNNLHESNPPSQDATQGTNNRSNWGSMGMSLLLHVSILVLLAFFFSGQSGAIGDTDALRSVKVVLTSVDESESQFEYQTEDQNENVNSLSQEESFDALPSESSPELPEVELSELPGFEVDPNFAVDASQMTTTPSNANPAEKYELTENDLKMIARDRVAIRRSAPKGDPANTQIFGSGNLSGRQFVFVIDRSKSMGGSGLGVLDMARNELSGALESLEDHHQFQVIAYHRSTVMIGERKLLFATDENKRRAPSFIQSLVAFGATRHDNGLTAALTFQPDVVVLMTDGGLPELNNGEIQAMAQMAGGRTEIHCVQFGSGANQERDNFMMRLATETDGSYRYIDVNEWDK